MNICSALVKLMFCLCMNTVYCNIKTDMKVNASCHVWVTDKVVDFLCGENQVCVVCFYGFS